MTVPKRFSNDFMFELTKEEYNSLRTQFATLKKGRGQHSKYNPYAFTEQGVSMLSSVLNSDTAVEVNISIIRAFLIMRQYLSDYKEIKDKITQIENEMQLKFNDIHQALNYLLQKDQQDKEQKERTKIGFK